jgi:hypothetical protein
MRLREEGKVDYLKEGEELRQCVSLGDITENCTLNTKKYINFGMLIRNQERK